MGYPFKQILAADPFDPAMVARNGEILLFAPGDTAMTPLVIWDLSHTIQLPNPVTVNDLGFGPAFIHDTLDQVAWSGGGLSGTFESYRGMRDDVEASRAAAESSAAAAIEAASTAQAPTDEVVNAVLSDPESTASGTVAAAITASVTTATAPLALKPDNGGKPVGKGELVINVKDYGAKGDYNSATKTGTDDTAALNAAAEAARAISDDTELYFPSGKYKITGTVIIRCGLNASQASLYYEGTGVAVQLGSSVPGVNLTRKRLHLPRVYQWTNNYNPTSWDGTSVGVLAYNLISCNLDVPFIQFFERGLVFFGNGAGCGYNRFSADLWSNHKNLLFTNDGAGGWSNQNTGFAGRISTANYNGNFDPEQSFVYCTGNNNTLIGTSMEGADECLYRVTIDGRFNAFINCRWESLGTSGPPAVLYTDKAFFNRITGGYNALNIVETFTSPGTGGTIQDGSDNYGIATSVGATTLPTGVETTIKAWNGFLGKRITFDPVTGEFKPRPGRWRITARIAFNANGTGFRQVSLTVGSKILDTKREGGFAGSISNPDVSSSYNFNGTETFKITAHQTSGADLTLNSSNYFCNLRADYEPF